MGGLDVAIPVVNADPVNLFHNLLLYQFKFIKNYLYVHVPIQAIIDLCPVMLIHYYRAHYIVLSFLMIQLANCNL